MNPVTASNSVVLINQVALGRVNSLRRELAITGLVLPLIELTMGWLIDEYALEEDEAFNTQHFWATINLENFPYLTILDKRAWAKIPTDKLELALEDGDAFNKQECVRTMRKLRTLVMDDEGLTLLTMPKGLSFNKLVAFDSISGLRTLFSYKWQEFVNAHGHQEVDKTYRILITNNILVFTENRSVESQHNFIKRLAIGCMSPKVLEMSALLIVTFVNSLKTLFPHRDSRCHENVAGNQLNVGTFSEDFGFSVLGDNVVHKRLGIAGCRQF